MTVLHRLFLTLVLSLVGISAVASEPSENVRTIVSGIVTYTRWPQLSGPPKLCIFSTSRYIHSLAEEAPELLPYKPVIVRNTEEAYRRPAMVFILAVNLRLSSLNLQLNMETGPYCLLRNKTPIALLAAHFACL